MLWIASCSLSLLFIPRLIQCLPPLLCGSGRDFLRSNFLAREEKHFHLTPGSSAHAATSSCCWGGERPLWALNIIYDHLHENLQRARLPRSCSHTCLTRIVCFARNRLCQDLSINPQPSLDPGSLSPPAPLRGGVSEEHGAQSAGSPCLCLGRLGENTPSRYADSLTEAGEEVEPRKCTLQTFQFGATKFYFFLNKDLYIFIHSQILIGRC